MERLGISEEPVRDDPLDEKRRRVRSLAPEALAGDADALAELERLEAEIATETRRRELQALAETEQADRERIAAEEEAKRQRQAAEEKMAELIVQRDAKLGIVEKSISTLVEAIAAVDDLDVQALVIGQPLGKKWGRVHNLVEFRLTYQLRQVNIRESGVLWGNQGREPLAVAAPGHCTVCTHDDREAIETALAGDETLRDFEERFGVSRSTLSRHRAGHTA
jgi:hypothetical protein